MLLDGGLVAAVRILCYQMEEWLPCIGFMLLDGGMVALYWFHAAGWRNGCPVLISCCWMEEWLPCTGFLLPDGGLVALYSFYAAVWRVGCPKTRHQRQLG